MNFAEFHSTRRPMLKAKRPMFMRLCITASALLLLHSAELGCGQDTDLEFYELPDAIGNASLGLGQAGRFLEAQLFATPVNVTVPTPGGAFFRIISWTSGFFQMRQCARADVYKCLRYGNATNGLPKGLQGVLWQNGVGFDEVAIPTAGTWDLRNRLLTLSPYLPGQWAGRGTGSTRLPDGTWSPSGAAHLNFLTTAQLRLPVYFNDELTFGWILCQIPIFGILITLPPAFIDWTMALLPDGSWERRSRTFGLEELDGLYYLRPIVTGDGGPGKFYPQWVKSRGGTPFNYIAEQISQ